MVPHQPSFPPDTKPQGHQDDRQSENTKHRRGRTIALVCGLLVVVVLLGYGMTVAIQRFSGAKPSVSSTVQRAGASPTSAAPLAPTTTPPHKFKPSKVVVMLSKADFSPALLTIGVGSTVIWKNTSPVAHTVTSDDGTFDSGDLPAGSTFRFTFKTAGSFHYTCTYHPWMTGTITVQ